MKKIINVTLYFIEIALIFISIFICIKFFTINLINQNTLHNNVQEGLIFNQIVVIILLIVPRFGFIPLKLFTKSIDLVGFYKVMSIVMVLINVFYFTILCILAFMIPQLDSQVYEIRNIILQFTILFGVINLSSGLILYIKYTKWKNLVFDQQK